MMNRALLSDILCDTYEIIEAEDGEQAINILQRDAADISLVILDMVMPKVDGFGALEAMNKTLDPIHPCGSDLGRDLP